MNLKLQTPKGISEDEVSFSLPFNINRKSKKVNGILTATKEKITIYVNDVVTQEYRISDFSEIEVEQLIGCSMICGKTLGGQWICFCAFTQTYFLRYAELAKILDFYIQTGEFTEVTSGDEPSCEKCGTALNGGKSCPFCVKKTGVFVKLIKRLKPHKKFFIMSLLATLALYTIDVINPILQRQLIDNLVVPNLKDWNLFFAVGGSIVGLSLFSFLFMAIMERCNFKMAIAYGRDLRRDVFYKSQELSMSNVAKRTPGELINRISSDTQNLQSFMTRQGKDMIFQSIALAALIVIMFITNWKLAVIVLIPLPLAGYLSAKSYNIIAMRYSRMWRYQCRAREQLHDVIHGIRVVKSYGSENREIKRYNKASRKWADSIKNADIVWYLISPGIGYLFSIGEFCVIYFGGSMVLGHEIPLGEMVQFITYVYMLYGPVQWLVQLPRVLAQASVSASKVFEVLEERNDLKNDGAVSIDIKGDISFERVYFGYKAYNPVLKDISFEIKQGEMIGVVGHSGVGKSTLINLIMRLYDTTSGVIKIDGVDIKDIEQTSLRSQVGVVLQETFLFNGTVLENIRYAKPEASFEEIVQAAKIANCHDFIVRLPDGYNTLVGERGYSISGGERQRVAIARAILHNPRVIILDEATASLDTQTEKQIQDALDRLIEGRTTIAIAHRLSTLSNADRLIVLDKGRVAEIGSHHELLQNKDGVYYKLVMAQRQTARIRGTGSPA